MGDATTSPEFEQIALNFLTKLSRHLAEKDADSIASMFLPKGWLKDNLVFDWKSRALDGPEKIAAYLREALPGTDVSPLVLDDSLVPPGKFTPPDYSGIQGVEFGFRFETPVLKGRGITRLLPDSDGSLKAFHVYFEARDIKGHEEADHELGLYGGHTISWGEVKNQRREVIEKDPEVIIIGAGQSGLQTAARFRQMNIRTIIIEQTPRVGDVWRKRYPMLTLHTPRAHHHLLYAPFPRNWPRFTPRDKLAAWLEQYAEAQDLVIWLSSSILPGPTFDPSSRRWTVDINKNGTKVTLHPYHIVLATGLPCEPIMPVIPNMDAFKGAIIHAEAYQGGEPFAGQRVLVVGAGNTSADICQDLIVRGTKEVTMLQRSETVVISAALKSKEWDAVFPESLPAEVNDFKLAAMPLGQLKQILIKVNKKATEYDREMLDGLASKGLKLSDGPDGAGNKILVFERAAGYWIDVGVSKFIMDGSVKLKHGVEIDHFTPSGVVYTDGTFLEVDTVIFATGYRNIRDSMRKIFGDEIIDKTSKVWGMNKEGELQGCFCRTGYPGLWYAVGDFYCGRYMSKQLGLLIQSELFGLDSLKNLAAVPPNGSAPAQTNGA